MNKIELQEYYWLMRNVNQLEDKLLELDTRVTKVTSSLTGMPKASGEPDKIPFLVSRIIEVQKEINEVLERAYRKVADIEKAIEVLPSRERYLIRARYVELKTWEQIAVDMNYSWKQVHRIHSAALKLITPKKDDTQ